MEKKMYQREIINARSELIQGKVIRAYNILSIILKDMEKVDIVIEQ